MGIFDFFEGDEKPQKGKLKTLSVTTNNIPKAYLSASEKMGLEPKELDFKLLKVETTIKVAEDADFEPISGEHATILKSKELLLNPELKFKQTYKVLFERRTPHKFFLKAQLEVDKSHSMAKAKILKSSQFPQGPDLKKWLVYEINKFKIKHHILLGIFDWHMKEDIAKLAAYLAKQGKLEKDVDITLSRWPVPPTLTQDDALIEHYKKKVDEAQKKINHAERDFSVFIKSGMLVLEYVKPAEGITGRDFAGHLVEAREPVVSHEPQFVIDTQTLEAKEDEHSTKYYAKKDGYVIMESGMLLISDEIQMDSIDLKSTGHVTSDTDKEISISIKGDATEDKIGPNMKVEVSNLSMGGSVAEGAEIRGKDIQIGGQTHLTSKIYTEKAKIKVHKGYLEAKEAKITSIESGVIYADTIDADMAIGAELHGKNIHIKEIKHHCVIEFSESLTIDKVQGEENKFLLTAFAPKDEGEALEALFEQLQNDKELLAKKEHLFQKLTDQVNKNKKNLELLEENIKEIRSTKQEPNESILKRYNTLVGERESHEKLQKEIATMSEAIGTMNETVEKQQEALFSARIHVKSRWHGYNEIYFNMLSPKKVIKYIPKEGYGPEEVFIGINDENEYDVKRRPIKAGEPVKPKPAETRTEPEKAKETEEAKAEPEELLEEDTEKAAPETAKAEKNEAADETPKTETEAKTEPEERSEEPEEEPSGENDADAPEEPQEDAGKSKPDDAEATPPSDTPETTEETEQPPSASPEDDAKT